jgi:hypothetical protein
MCRGFLIEIIGRVALVAVLWRTAPLLVANTASAAHRVVTGAWERQPGHSSPTVQAHRKRLLWSFDLETTDNDLAHRSEAGSTLPSTTATLIGPAGNNGWFRGPVQVTLSASDRNGPVAGTSYTVDAGLTLLYSAPFTLSQNGRHQVTYFSTDPTGNDETVQILEVKIDSVPPSVTVSATPSSLWPPNNQIVTVTVRGMLADVVPGSGLDRASARFTVIDTYSQAQPSGTLAVGPGGSYTVTVLLPAWRNGDDRTGRTYTIVVSASDVAGNIGTGSARVRVPHDQGAFTRHVLLIRPTSSTLSYREPIASGNTP